MLFLARSVELAEAVPEDRKHDEGVFCLNRWLYLCPASKNEGFDWSVVMHTFSLNITTRMSLHNTSYR